MESFRPISDRNVGEIVFGEQRKSANERVVEGIVSEAMTKYVTIPEGPPIYLWPALVEQRWDNPAFVRGWAMVNAISERLPVRKLKHYVLIDDLNSRPEGVTEQALTMRMGGVWQTADEVGKSPIFNDDKGEVVRISEAELAASAGSTVCSVLDAQFNKQKIIDQIRDLSTLGLCPGYMDKLMLVVVSPGTLAFKAEQLNMVQALYEALRRDPVFARASKEDTRRSITETYRHVWLDGNGIAVEKTKIVYTNGRFSFRYEVF